MLPAGRQAQASRQTTSPTTPVALARMLIEDPRALNIVDIREPKICKGPDRIPQAVCFNDIRDNIEFMYKGKPMVVYSQDGKKNLPAELFKYKGRITALEGGYDAWNITVIGKPPEAYQAVLNASSREEGKTIAAIHAYFTGAKMEVRTETNKPGVIINAPKKRSGGCS
jgi:hypothetical protein